MPDYFDVFAREVKRHSPQGFIFYAVNGEEAMWVNVVFTDPTNLRFHHDTYSWSTGTIRGEARVTVRTSEKDNTDWKEQTCTGNLTAKIVLIESGHAYRPESVTLNIPKTFDTYVNVSEYDEFDVNCDPSSGSFLEEFEGWWTS